MRPHNLCMHQSIFSDAHPLSLKIHWGAKKGRMVIARLLKREISCFLGGCVELEIQITFYFYNLAIIFVWMITTIEFTITPPTLPNASSIITGLFTFIAIYNLITVAFICQNKALLIVGLYDYLSVTFSQGTIRLAVTNVRLRNASGSVTIKRAWTTTRSGFQEINWPALKKAQILIFESNF